MRGIRILSVVSLGEASSESLEALPGLPSLALRQHTHFLGSVSGQGF